MEAFKTEATLVARVESGVHAIQWLRLCWCMPAHQWGARTHVRLLMALHNVSYTPSLLSNSPWILAQHYRLKES
jgi:hypothetical protein